MKLSGKIGITLAACITVLGLTVKPASGQAPVFVISPEQSTIKFYVKSSVDIQGDFNKWDATLTFTSPKVSTGVLDIEIQAASVNTGSDMKDGKLKSKDFFDVKHDPLITFKSTKIVRTSPGVYRVQ